MKAKIFNRGFVDENDKIVNIDWILIKNIEEINTGITKHDNSCKCKACISYKGKGNLIAAEDCLNIYMPYIKCSGSNLTVETSKGDMIKDNIFDYVFCNSERGYAVTDEGKVIIIGPFDHWEGWEIKIVKKYYSSEGDDGVQKRITKGWQRRLRNIEKKRTAK